MAKYTELYAEYIANGNTPPTIFNEIEGFSDLFLKYYCDKEIGFETEELFKIKLEAYAELLIPKYKERIDDLASALTKARNPIKVRYSTNNTTINNGNRKTKTTELPFDSESAEPNIISENEASIDNNASINNQEESGVSVDEAYKVINELNKGVNIILLQLLKAFSKCFMAVY